MVSYAAILCCLFGLFGATLAQMLGGMWWGWATVAWAVVAILGVTHVSVNATVLAVLLVTEIGVVVAFDLAALTHPAGGRLDLAALWPGTLSGPGVGGALALCVACFVGYESTLAFAEEARTHGAVARASFGSLAFLGLLYTVSAWAMVAATGPDQITSASAEVVFGVLGERYGPLVAVLGSLLLVTSILAAMISFHATIARYLYVLTRERLLPGWFGRIRHGSGVPVGGSLVASAIALLVVAVWAGVGGDPMTSLGFSVVEVILEQGAVSVEESLLVPLTSKLRLNMLGAGSWGALGDRFEDILQEANEPAVAILVLGLDYLVSRDLPRLVRCVYKLLSIADHIGLTNPRATRQVEYFFVGDWTKAAQT